MNGTLKNYLLHMLSGSVIYAVLFLIAWGLGFHPGHWVATFGTLVWWYAHETTDREHSLKGPARKNLQAAAFWKWSIDNHFDFLSGVAVAFIASTLIEIL